MSTDNKCVVQKENKNIELQLRKEILKKATLYQRQSKEKNKIILSNTENGWRC